MRARLQKLQEYTELNMQTLHKLYVEAKEEINGFRKKMNDALDELEKTSLNEVEDLMRKLKESLLADVDHCRRIRKQLNRMVEAVKDVGEKGIDLFFIAQTKCSEMFKESDGLLAEKCLAVHRNLIFRCDTDIEEYLTKMKGLGVVASNDETFSIKTESKLNVKIWPYTSNCYISGIASLPNNQILIADYNNRKVKLLNQNYQVVSHCDLSSRPRDLYQINTSNELAVTVDDGKIHEIQFIELNNGQLVKGTQVQLIHTCNGIANHRGNLYVTSLTALYHYTITGTLVKKLYEDTTGGYTVYKCAVNSSGDKIYITNAAKNKLLTLSKDGSVLSTFSDPELQCPYGEHVTPFDQVLVCGHSSHTVLRVDSDGKKKIAQLVLQKDGVKNPESVYYNIHTCSVIIACNYNYYMNELIAFDVV